MKKRTYWNILTEDILQNRPLVFFTILTAILSFGFAVTHFSIGIDDMASSYYLSADSLGNMVQQGRLLHMDLNTLTRTLEFLPFFMDFVGAFLFTVSALLYCTLFYQATEGKLTTAALTVFTCVYLSSSITAEKFIYQLDVLVTMLSYCCGAVSLMYAQLYVKKKDVSAFLKSFATLVLSIASYESFIFLYVCGVFALMVLEALYCDDYRSFRSILLDGLKYALILITTVFLYYGLVALVQRSTGQYGIFVRDSIWNTSTVGFFPTFAAITGNITQYFAQSLSLRYIPIIAFCLFSLAGTAMSLILSFRKKNGWLALCFLALFLSNFFIHYAIGSFTARAAQTFCFFAGFCGLLLVETFRSQPLLKNTACAAMVLLVFIQSADMTRWFYNDYARYQKEKFVIDTIANKLVSEYDPSKPLIFTNAPLFGHLNTDIYPGRQQNGNSLIYWMGYAFEDKTQPFITEVFRFHGYDFVQSPTPEQYDAACEKAEAMAIWPQRGSIQEFQDFIVVNFG